MVKDFSIQNIKDSLRSYATNLRLLYVFIYACGSSWLSFFALYLKNQELTGTQIGYITSIVWVVTLLVQPLWGVVADRMGRMFSFRLAVMATSVALISLYVFGTSIISIVVCTLICSIFWITMAPLLDTLVLDYVEGNPSAKTSFGELRFWGAVGAILGTQGGSIAMEYLPLNSIFLVSAGFLIMAMPYMLRKTEQENSSVSMKMEFGDVKSLLSNRALIVFLVFMGVISLCQTSIWYYLPVYMTDIGASPYWAGSILSVDALVELPFYYLAALFFRKIGIKNTLLFTAGVTALRLLLYSINSEPAWAIAIDMVTQGLSWTIFWLAAVEFTNMMVKPEWRATGQSLLWAVYQGAGQIAGSLWAGHLYEDGSMNIVYGINGAIALVATLVAVFYFRKIIIKKI